LKAIPCTSRLTGLCSSSDFKQPSRGVGESVGCC
jgi:hypothetical protein